MRSSLLSVPLAVRLYAGFNCNSGELRVIRLLLLWRLALALNTLRTFGRLGCAATMPRVALSRCILWFLRLQLVTTSTIRIRMTGLAATYTPNLDGYEHTARVRAVDICRVVLADILILVLIEIPTHCISTAMAHLLLELGGSTPNLPNLTGSW